MRLAAPDRQRRRRPGVPARGDEPKRGIGHQTLAALGEFAGRWKSSLFEALFAESLADALTRRAIGGLHEFGRVVNALQDRARETTGGEDAKALLLGWLKDIGYEQHLHEGEDSQQLAAARWTQRARLRRLDRAALRRQRTRRRPARPRKRRACSTSRRRSR